MTEREPRLFVVDTSVAVKFYVPEDGHEDALKLLDSEEIFGAAADDMGTRA